MTLSLEMTTSHPHLYLEKKEAKTYFVLHKSLRLSHSKTFQLLINFENDPQEQEDSDRNAYKEEVKVYPGLINTSLF